MRILIIEDEKKVAAFIKKGLEEEYYTADTAHNGKDGLDLAAASEYDAMIVDMMIPPPDGLSVIRTLRENGNNTPILILTAKDSVSDKIAGLDSGADDYLTKPFAFEELLARLRALLRRKETYKSPQLKAGELVLNVETHKVTCAGKEITLTQKEYSILEYLLRNKNKVVSRTKLIEHVYEYQFDTETNIVDVYINKLRSKIEAANGESFIYTVRGVGYILKDEKE